VAPLAFGKPVAFGRPLSVSMMVRQYAEFRANFISGYRVPKTMVRDKIAKHKPVLSLFMEVLMLKTSGCFCAILRQTLAGNPIVFFDRQDSTDRTR